MMMMNLFYKYDVQCIQTSVDLFVYYHCFNAFIVYLNTPICYIHAMQKKIYYFLLLFNFICWQVSNNFMTQQELAKCSLHVM